MPLIQKTIVNNSCFFIHIEEINFKLLCSSPADSVKHLRKLGIIKSISKDDIMFDDGPNAILLADTSMQNGCLCNLSEFPVLHMLYLQGMIVPNHPNNNGKKPLIIGSTEQVASHIDYIYLGNYGITRKEDMLDIGISEQDAEKYISMKKAFAFGRFKESHELLDFINIEEEEIPILIQENLFIKRESRNIFTIKYKNESVLIDLNLKKDEVYYAPYNLGYYQTKLEHFAVSHIGNGDGWNMDEPSMSSVLFNDGKIYLIDTGPNISYLLDRMSISINQVVAVFITHVHDDHFCGLLSLMDSDTKITIYAVSIVRVAIIAKLSITLNVSESMLYNFVDFVDLQLDSWNEVSSFDVKPIISPHPIETTILYFRKMTKDGYKTYGHLADLASFDVLDNLSKPHENDENQSLFNFYQYSKKNYLLETDLKKIDAGGGMIHGQVGDFKDDKSRKIIIAHKSKKATIQEVGIASETFFGSLDVLDKSYVDYDLNNVYKIINGYLHGDSSNYLNSMANSEIITFNPGNIIVKQGEKVENIYLTLQGNTNRIDNDGSIKDINSGSFLREHILFSKENNNHKEYRLSFIKITDDEVYQETQIAKSFVRTLKISKHIFNKFLDDSLFYYQKVENISFQKFIYKSSLLENAISSATINQIVKNMKIHTFPKDSILHNKLTTNSIFFIYSGDVHVKFCNNKPNMLTDGDYFGAKESVFSFLNIETMTVVSQEVILLEVQTDVLLNAPIIYRKMLEEYIEHKVYIYNFVSKNIHYKKDDIFLPDNIEVKYKILMEKVAIFQYMYERFEDKKLIENFIKNLIKNLKIYSDEVELILLKNIKLKDVFRFLRKDIKNIMQLLSDDLNTLEQDMMKYESIKNIINNISLLLSEHKKTLKEKLDKETL